MNFLEYLEWLDRNRLMFPVELHKKKQPKHPGKVIREEFVERLGLTQSELAKQLNCRFAKINEILNEKRSITPNFALQLEKVLGLPAEVWMSLQAEYDLWKERQRHSA